jgi:hypothetical protein
VAASEIMQSSTIGTPMGIRQARPRTTGMPAGRSGDSIAATPPRSSARWSCERSGMR